MSLGAAVVLQEAPVGRPAGWPETASCSQGEALCVQAPYKHLPGRNFCPDDLLADGVYFGSVHSCYITVFKYSAWTGKQHRLVFVVLIKPKLWVNCCAGDDLHASECQKGNTATESKSTELDRTTCETVCLHCWPPMGLMYKVQKHSIISRKKILFVYSFCYRRTVKAINFMLPLLKKL